MNEYKFCKIPIHFKAQYNFLGWKNDSKLVLKQQKKVLKTIKVIKNWVSCRQIRKEFRMLTLTSLHTVLHKSKCL